MASPDPSISGDRELVGVVTDMRDTMWPLDPLAAFHAGMRAYGFERAPAAELRLEVAA